MVPRSRKKVPIDSQSEPVQEEPTLLPEPEVEALPPTRKKTKTKTLAVVKRKPKRPDTLDAPPIAEPQSEPQSHEPIPLPEPAAEALPQPKKRTKPKAPATVKLKSKRSDTFDAPLPVHEQKHEQEHEPSIPSVHPITDPAPSKKIKSTRHLHNEKEANKHAEKTLEQEFHHDIVATPVEEQPPKKKKVVRRVRVPRMSTKPATPATSNSSGNAAADTDISKPSAPTDDVHKDLFEAVAPAPATKKIPKAPKRIFFNDDSDVDLDQMLSGIAAMAGTKAATKPVTSKSRATRKKVAS